MGMDEQKPSSGYDIQSVVRALRVLELLAAEEASLSLRDITERAGLSKPTVFRILSTLKKMDYVEQEPVSGNYLLGLKVFEMGSAFIDKMSLRSFAMPLIQELVDKYNETVHLAILDKSDIVYIDKIDGTQTIRMMSAVGKRGPAHCTSVGKAILAHKSPEEQEEILGARELVKLTKHSITDKEALKKELEQIKQKGYAIDNEEQEIGLKCVGVPIFDYHGKVIGGISVSGPSSRFSSARLKNELIPLVVETAEKISHRMGYKTHPNGGNYGKKD
jgi:IclR family KDG regulon transcriptional repressor